MTGSPVQPLNTCPAGVDDGEEPPGLTAAADAEDDEGLPDPLLEHRIAAAADLARHEERIRVAAMTALRRWTDLVRGAVLGQDTLTAAAAEIPPDANAIPPLSAQWSTILTDTVDAELTGMLGEVFAAVLGEETTVSARPWQESYIAEVHNRLTGVADSTFDLIRDVIADGQAGGADIPTLRGLISDVLATRGESTWAGRARTIARSESIGAYNGGQLQAWKVQAAQTGDVREKAWLCLAGDVPVLAVGVVAAARRWYDGPLIVARTAQGRRVAVTPNHELLSDRGWQRAQDLHEGDHLIAVLGVDPVGPASPPLGAVIDAALGRALPGDPQRAATWVDLEGQVLTGDRVEVVPADRALRAALQPHWEHLEGVGSSGTDGSPDGVAPDEVVEIRREWLTAHVYDLHTDSGWFTADGVITHNSTIDRRTRKDHYRADGQRVALDAKFVVGHAQLDHPGDPHGPAKETVNCRCAMLILDADEDLPDATDRQLRPAGEVQAEIDRRAADGDLRASEDPDAPAGPRAPRQQESPAPPPAPIPEVVPRPAAQLNTEQYDALLPRRGGWTTKTRKATVATLKTSPSGRRLEKVLASFQHGTSRSIPLLRTDLEKHLAGGGGLSEGRRDAMGTLLDAIANCDAGDRTLYRGMSIPGDFESVAARYEVDSTVDISLGSFSTDSKLATEFSQTGAGQKVRGATRTPVVIEWLGETKRALPIENLAPSRVFANEREWIGSGRFRIVEAKKARRGGHDVLLIRMEQLDTFPPGGAEALTAAAGDPEGMPEIVPDEYLSTLFREVDPDGEISAALHPGADEAAEDEDEDEDESPPQTGAGDASRTAAGSPAPGRAGTVDTVTAAGSGPGATSGTEGTAMPRKWVSDPYLAPFDEASGDGRIIKPGALHARELPLPLLFQESSGFGHEGSVVVGKIGEASFADGGITAAGEYLDDPSVAEAVGKAVTLAESGLGHVSVDLGAVTAELVDEAGNPVDWDDLFDAWEDGQDIVVLEQVIDGELIAVTQVATPAFASAKIRLLAAALIDTAGTDIGIGDTVDVVTEDAGTVRGRVTGVDEESATVSVQPIDEAGADAGDVLAVAPGAVTVVIDVDEPTEPAPAPAAATAGLVFAVDSAGAQVAVGDAVLTDLRDTAGEVLEAGVAGTVTGVAEADGDTPAVVTVERSDGAGSVSVPAAQVTVTAKAPAEPAAAEPVAALLAGVGPLRPKREWFDQQPLPGFTALTITDEGQVYGTVAQWGQCHVGFANTCWTAPESATGYAYFQVGEVVCTDGSRVAVGNLTLGPRHANERLGYRAAIEHYDSAAAGVAVGRCYEDEWGIQFAGALAANVTEEQLYDMRRCPVSGDWRRIGGNLELIGVLSVNSGGYPTPRFATDDAGRTALVAAPGVPVPALEAARGRRSRNGGLSQRQVMDRLKAELRTELAAEQGRRRRLASVASSIRRDPRSRLAAAAARVHQ